MFCTSCGKQIADGSLFCTSCGSRLAPADQPKTSIEKAEVLETISSEVPEISVDQDVSPAVTPAVTAAVPVIGTGGLTQAKPVANAAPIVSASSIVPPKKSNKGIMLAIAGVAVIVILILVLGKGSGGFSEYKDLVKGYYTAIYKNDSNAVIKMFDKDIQKEMKDYKSDIKDTVDTMKTDWDDQYDMGWNKLVEAAGRVSNGKSHYMVQVQLDGEDFDTLYIKKVDNKYYIDEDNTPFY